MLRNVVAIERDGLDVRVLTIIFEVPDEKFNLRYWVRKAATDYVNTEEGRKIYDYNCSYFNWADFAMNVPNTFCEKYGFSMVDTAYGDIEVDWDEELVNEDELYFRDEEG